MIMISGVKLDLKFCKHDELYFVTNMLMGEYAEGHKSTVTYGYTTVLTILKRFYLATLQSTIIYAPHISTIKKKHAA